MATRRVKIGFTTKSDKLEINAQDIVKTKRNIGIAMKAVVRDFERKDTASNKRASELILNA